MPLTFTRSQRNSKQLIVDNYIFNKIGEASGEGGKVTWRCIEYHTKSKCKCLAYITSTHKNGMFTFIYFLLYKFRFVSVDFTINTITSENK